MENNSIPTAKDLQFSLSKNPDRARCNNCGGQLNPTGSLASTIWINKETVFSLFMCDQECVSEFKSGPTSDEYIANQIRNKLKK